MGPRSDNRGYGMRLPQRLTYSDTLQWVHGPITVVTKDRQEAAGVPGAGFNGSTVR